MITKKFSDNICHLAVALQQNQIKNMQIEILTKQIKMADERLKTLQRILKEQAKGGTCDD